MAEERSGDRSRVVGQNTGAVATENNQVVSGGGLFGSGGLKGAAGKSKRK